MTVSSPPQRPAPRPLHGEEDVGGRPCSRPMILILGAEKLVHHRRQHFHLRARPGAADDELLRFHVVPGLDRRIVQRHRGLGGVHAADPDEIARVELRPLGPIQRRQGRVE